MDYMKDFVFRNDTELFFRNDVRTTIAEITKGHKGQEDDSLYGTRDAGTTVGVHPRQQEQDVIRCRYLIHQECA